MQMMTGIGKPTTEALRHGEKEDAVAADFRRETLIGTLKEVNALLFDLRISAQICGKKNLTAETRRRAENARRKTLNGSTIVTQAQTKHFRRPRLYGTMAFIQ